jgi:Uma2 family endonuclease
MQQTKLRFTLEEYLALDKVSEERLEYWDGQIFNMSGASPEHVRIQRNLTGILFRELKNKKCEVFTSDMRIKVPDYPPYRYPDLSALCGEPIFETLHGLKVLTNPSLIVEILSPSTEEFDQSDKFTYYKSIPTFTEYLLISQDKALINRHFKAREEWEEEIIEGLNKEVRLLTVDSVISLQELYTNVLVAP